MAMRRLSASVLALVVVAAAAPEARAQRPIPETVRMSEPYRLRIGNYVRAWPGTGDAPVVEGPIVGFSFSTLTLAGREEATLVDLATARRLEVRRRDAHYRRGALIGAGLGVVASLLLVTRELFGHEIGAWERAGWTAGLTAGGTVLGLGAARVLRSERWEPVDLQTLRPHATDAGPALRLQYALRF